MANIKPRSIDEYIAGFPERTRELLEKVRSTIRKAAPKAEETISYAIPCFNLNGNYLVYFAGYKKHISVYPAKKGDAAYEKAVARYRTGKGTYQFPLDKPIPYTLITKIVKFNIRSNGKRAKEKKG